MLIRVSIENFRSFDKRAELSMISSSKIRENMDHRIKIKQANILKNAVVYGANASGKSNLVTAFTFIKAVLEDGLSVGCENEFCRNRIENKERESIFELQFTVNDEFYAYGFSAVLSERRITEEWLYRLNQNGGARLLFAREGNKAPVLGPEVRISDADQSRFDIYAADFAGRETQLFLTEMNRNKRYQEKSPLRFFPEAFHWIKENIIIIRPNIGISNTDAYYNDQSLENIKGLIRTFDTGITDISTRRISIDEMSKMLPHGMARSIIEQVQSQMQSSNDIAKVQMTWRVDDGFFNVQFIKGNAEPEITTLVLSHGNSSFEFSFSDESDGTKRLFDLIDMLLTDRPDTLYVVDELERSLHPKLTEHFLRLFMEAHAAANMQMVFTTHEASIMDQNLYRRDEIWFVERDADHASRIYSLDRFKERYDKKRSKAYLEGRYGAIPVFQEFTFPEGES